MPNLAACDRPEFHSIPFTEEGPEYRTGPL